MRLARADAAAYELSQVALAWSRGPDDGGAITLQQVERISGTYEVEVASIRPLPPIAAMLLSEAVHHLRSAVDNVVFYVAEKEHGQALTPQQERIVSMLVHDQPEKFENAVKRLTTGKNALPMFDQSATLGERIASLQPFNDGASLPSLSPVLAMLMGVEPVWAHPLALLRDYSNEDKHRAIRVGAAGVLTQVLNEDWQESVVKGMRHVEVGTVLERVPKGAFTGMEISPALQVQRPDGTWVGPGPELDGMARHVADIVIPTLLTGMALPDALPAQIDLGDNGETLAERLKQGSKARAHERARGIMAAALVEAESRGWKVAPVTKEG
jgi:hypothetical protein